MNSEDLCVILRDVVSAPASVAKLDPKTLPNFFLLFISCDDPAVSWRQL